MLEVVSPGVLLTLQDRGRAGLAHLGVPPSGPADPWAYEVATVLAGWRPDAGLPGPVALEVTLGGTHFRILEACALALAGADLGAELDDGTRLASGSVQRVAAGSEVRFTGGTGADGGPAAGMRAYVALAGGIEARLVLGSASTCVSARLGGIDGRPLRAGDVIVPVRHAALDAVGRAWPLAAAPHPARSRAPIAFVPGPDLGRLPPGASEALQATTWRVGDACDRMGIRLDPAGGSRRLEPTSAPIPLDPADRSGRAQPANASGPLEAGHEILSHPVVPGAIQVPADGRPVILFVDGPTIGGYPVIGVVPRWQWPRLGQLRPGDEVTFAPQDAESARGAWNAQRAEFGAGVSRMSADAVWDRLADGAGS